MRLYMSDHFAVMGNPIAHSLSPMIHEHFAKEMGKRLIYEKITVEESLFEQQVRDFFARGGKGLNITAPFKQRAFSIAAERSFRCQQAKAANTLWLKKGRLYADNTDGVGFIKDLSQHFSVKDSQVLILGAGGAARGIIAPLLAAGIAKLRVANRDSQRFKSLAMDFPQIKMDDLEDRERDFDLVVNATSSRVWQPLLPILSLKEKRREKPIFGYDLSYSLTRKTAFTQWAEKNGFIACDGLGMLIEQAAEAFFIWHGLRPNTSSLKKKMRLLVTS